MNFEIPPFFILIGLLIYLSLTGFGLVWVGLLWGYIAATSYFALNIAPWAYVIYQGEERLLKAKRSPGGFLGDNRQMRALIEYCEKYVKPRDNED